jgi:hypothetical protein
MPKNAKNKSGLFLGSPLDFQARLAVLAFTWFSIVF